MKSSKGQVPHDKTLDNSLALLIEGYQFIQNRCCKYQSNIFQTRLMGKNVICISGEEAAKLFYDNRRFIRKKAAPKRILKTLFGENGVQALDGGAHKHRKLMFMSLMTPQNLNVLSKYTVEQWQIVSSKWENKNKLVLFDEVQEILCRVACQWAGVPLQDKEVCKRSKDLGKMVDAFGAVGPRHWQGRCARLRTEKWIKDIIIQVRTHKLNPADNTALYTIAWHRNLEGKLLGTQVAAVELINIVRPIVAIATYITFGALALYQYPSCHKKIKSGEEDYIQMFVQEIRRFYPFAPFVGARVRETFTWKHCRFKKGRLVLRDIYGTNHDSRVWKRPNEFLPERFNNWKGDPFNFVPQGGGDCNNGHRCAGEGVTIDIMKASIDYLTNHLDYKVPKQNLKYSIMRMPTLPKSRFVINKVKHTN
jgi:fatty-acid peroxygenase